LWHFDFAFFDEEQVGLSGVLCDEALARGQGFDVAEA
jgi:hypothetical protein